MTYVIDLPSPRVLPVLGIEAGFPVHRIWCVAQNYAAHAREMGADPARDPPRFFAKPPDAAAPPGTAVRYPPATEELHHEVELVLALQRGGSRLAESEALACIYGCAVGVDLTRRDLQRQAKAAGQPWDLAKGFDNAAPTSAVHPGPPPTAAQLELRVNGEVRQQADISHMIWKPDELLARLSALVSLAAGDLVFTGTPSGVGPLCIGDHVQATLSGIANLEFDVSS